MKIFDRVLNPREIRRRLGLNQEQFWTQIGVTQSGGSRYESGREMPKPVRELLRLVHVEQVDLSQVKRVDFEIISYLKESHPDLYRSLRRAVQGQAPASDGPALADPSPELSAPAGYRYASNCRRPSVHLAVNEPCPVRFSSAARRRSHSAARRKPPWAELFSPKRARIAQLRQCGSAQCTTALPERSRE